MHHCDDRRAHTPGSVFPVRPGYRSKRHRFLQHRNCIARLIVRDQHESQVHKGMLSSGRTASSAAQLAYSLVVATRLKQNPPEDPRRKLQAGRVPGRAAPTPQLRPYALGRAAIIALHVQPRCWGPIPARACIPPRQPPSATASAHSASSTCASARFGSSSSAFSAALTAFGASLPASPDKNRGELTVRICQAHIGGRKVSGLSVSRPQNKECSSRIQLCCCFCLARIRPFR